MRFGCPCLGLFQVDVVRIQMYVLDLKDSPSLCIEPRVKKARPFFRTADTELECKTDVANTSLEQCLFLVAVLFWLQTSFSPGQVWILRGRLVNFAWRYCGEPCKLRKLCRRELPWACRVSLVRLWKRLWTSWPWPVPKKWEFCWRASIVRHTRSQPRTKVVCLPSWLGSWRTKKEMACIMRCEAKTNGAVRSSSTRWCAGSRSLSQSWKCRRRIATGRGFMPTLAKKTVERSSMPWQRRILAVCKWCMFFQWPTPICWLWGAWEWIGRGWTSSERSSPWKNMTCHNIASSSCGWRTNLTRNSWCSCGGTPWSSKPKASRSAMWCRWTMRSCRDSLRPAPLPAPLRWVGTVSMASVLGCTSILKVLGRRFCKPWRWNGAKLSPMHGQALWQEEAAYGQRQARARLLWLAAPRPLPVP